MRTIYTNHLKSLATLMLAAMAALLVSCGGSGVTTTTTAAPSISIALTDSATGLTTTSTPATVKATVLDASGAAIPNVVVTFTTDATLATMTPSSGTALTNASGVAAISLLPAGTTSGAATITATAQVSGSAVTNSAGYSIGAATVGAATISVSTPIFGVGTSSLSAFGTTSVNVTVSSGGVPVTTPQTVTFSSGCSSSGKAVLGSVVTVNGVATGSYRDNGCAGTDTVVASVTGGLASSSATLTVSAAPSISIALTDSATGLTTTSTPATVKATVLDAAGAAVPNVVVTFTTDATLATMTPSSGTALTNASGVAGISLLPAGTTSGAATITATTQVSDSAVTNSIGYSIGGTTVSVSTPIFGVGTSSLSAFGTTSVNVTVSSGGVPVTTPQTVTFSSGCSSSGKAVLGSVVTVNGVATGSYRDNGCAGTDTVVASVTGGLASSSATLTVLAPITGSIQYVSAAPTNISLQGSGGVTTSLVTFKVVDSGGNPISGKTVTFGLSTTVGGINLTSTTGISDTNGLVVARVNSGIVSTPVRVTATTPAATAGVTLTSQSSQLSITTGIPDNSDFTIAATTLNMNGLNYDGSTTVITARLADHFKNPAPDGTTVNFTSEAGSIIGSCNTTAGACSSTLTSMGTRPSNGRVSVLAYAIGEETFTDMNGNGVADLVPNEMVDVNSVPTDLPDAWLDVNENNIHDSSELYFNLAAGAAYTAADGKYSGVLCNSAVSSAGTCAASQTVYVRDKLVIVFSGDSATITMPLITPSLTQQYTIKVVDVKGNAMPAGTTVILTTTSTGAGINGSLTSYTYVVPNTNGCLKSTPGFPTGCPTSVESSTFGDIPVTFTAGASGVLTVKVTTPAPTEVVTSSSKAW